MPAKNRAREGNSRHLQVAEPARAPQISEGKKDSWLTQLIDHGNQAYCCIHTLDMENKRAGIGATGKSVSGVNGSYLEWVDLKVFLG